ncbi:MAG: hypothetical protein JWR12_2083 [Mucilaginibacter sp.]|jgi:hypothetical protein|nr:hypothetical protein [Mucilaginibacter sp.]
MKNYLIIISFIFISDIVHGQGKISITKIESKSWTSTLCSVDTVIRKSNDVMSVSLFKISNPSGSAHVPETDEVSKRILIAVSSIDDSPEQHLYTIGNFYNPKIVKFDKLNNNNFQLILRYGSPNSKEVSFTITLGNILMSNK